MNVGPLRFFHVNVNCSDLERSLEFYRDHVGLRLTVRTRPDWIGRYPSTEAPRCEISWLSNEQQHGTDRDIR